ncbi:MAG: Dabb family protein [Kiritimatiellia bacterium]
MSMFSHVVLFWLKPGLSADETARFDRGVKTLLTIPTLRHGWVGTPASTRRPVIDHSYLLRAQHGDQADHDAYQADPVHLRFIEECLALGAGAGGRLRVKSRPGVIAARPRLFPFSSDWTS